MSFLTRFSLKNPAAIIIIAVSVTLAGVFSAMSLKKETMPDINIPIVAIVTPYPGASPTDILEDVTKPIEDSLMSVKGIETISSTSSENVSTVIAQFSFSADMKESKKEVEEALKSIKLPEETLDTNVSRINFDAFPIMQLSISNKEVSDSELQEAVKEIALKKLSSLDGVGQAQITGEESKSIFIRLKPEQLAKHQLTSQLISQQLQIHNVAFPVGEVTLEEVKQPVKVTGKIKTIEELKNLRIGPVTLSELASITVESEEKTSISRINGETSIGIDIIKSQDANTVDVADLTKEALVDIEKQLPEGTKIEIISDQSDIVNESINGMVKEGILGAIFASVAILFFLKNFRTTFISIISIPSSILIALLFLKQMDITLNVLTLGALAMAIARVVDDSIVVIENIYRHLQEKQERTEDVIKFATKEVTMAITSSTITTMAVFLPLAFVEGMVGVLFKPFAFTVVISLLASLFVAVTIVPMLAKFMLLNGKIKEENKKDGKLIIGYQRLLTWTLNHKTTTLITTFIIFIGSLSLIPLVGTSFMPTSGEKQIMVDFSLPAGTSITETNKEALLLEKKIDSIDNISTYQTTIGSPSNTMTMMSSGTNQGSIVLHLDDDSKSADTLAKVTEELTTLNGATTLNIVEIVANSGMSTNSLEVTVSGPNMETINEGANIVTKKLENMKELSDITSNVSESKPEISIQVDQEKANNNGLSAAQVGSSVRELIGATTTYGTIKVDKENLEIKLGLNLNKVTKIEDIKGLDLTTPFGKVINLQDVAEVKEVPGPVTLFTKNRMEYGSVQATIDDKNTGKITASIQKELDSTEFPKGVEVKIGGITEQMNDSFKQLGFAIAIAIGVVYLVMVITFGEAKAPFAILFSLPLAVIGGFLGLFIAGIPLDMPSMIGFLMLIGIVVTNAIVLIDRVQHLRENGSTIREALLEAGTVRMRPILMTAVATIGALSPLALGLSSGSIMSQSLAVVVIGGLTSSTLLTLLVVPVIFELITKKKK